MTEITDFAFDVSRLCQALWYNRAWTDYEDSVAAAVLHASRLALQDVDQERNDLTFRVVSAPTGSGKTIGSLAVASAGVFDPTFSAAFVVETIRQVDEVGRELINLVGAEHVKVWSSGHDLANRPEQMEEIEEEHGRLLAPRSLKKELRDARVVVVTHALWRGEIDRGKEGGVRYYKGQRRSVVFVDEHPELVQIIERQPNDFLRLRDLIHEATPSHPAIPVLEELTERADAALKGDGAGYAPCVVAVVDMMDLFEDHGHPLNRAKSLGLGHVPLNVLNEIDLTCRFLLASAKGCSFRSRQGFSLVAYEADFDPGPGHVLLDATADITGMVELMGGVETVDIENVDFSNLSIVHVRQPKGFENVSEVVKLARLARPYAEWMRHTVLEHTEPGDDVLVVTHKAMLDRGYLEGSENPDTPLDWEGRKVNTIHWGIGIGSNKYRHKGVVFSFSEFHKPLRTSIATAFGWTKAPLNSRTIADANVPLNPKGMFLTARDGHLLRWNKQLVCRGNVRNIDAEGRCGKMKWVTSMDPHRLVASIPVMFPGAPLPALGKPEAGQRESKVDALCRLLTVEALRPRLWANEIEEATGIKANNLAWEIGRSPALQTTMDSYGWRLASAKELGQPGRMKALVRDGNVAEGVYIEE
jgi:hypothetical protein